MKVLVYLHVALWQIHLAEIIEVILSHLDNDDEVHLLRCTGTLASCPANAYHKISFCNECKFQSDHVVNLIGSNRLIDHILRIANTGSGKSYGNFKDIEELKRFSLEGVPHGYLVGSTIIDALSDCFPDTIALTGRISELLESSVSLFIESSKLMSEIKPDRVYVWSGRRCSDGPVIYAAKRMGIEFCGLLSGGEDNMFAIFKNGTLHDLEFQKRLLEDLYRSNQNEANRLETARKAFEEFRGGQAKYPSFVHFASSFRKNSLPNLDSRKRLVVVFTSSYWEFASLPHFSRGLYPNHYTGLENILSDENLDKDIELVVRWHPNLKNVPKESGDSRLVSSLSNKYASRALFISPESDVDSYALMEAAEKIVTFGSTIGIEAAYYGKPSILVGGSYYESTGACYTPRSHGELINLINSSLAPRNIEGALKYGYYIKSYGQHKFNFLKRNINGEFLLNGTPIHKKSLIRPFANLPRRISRKIRRILLDTGPWRN